MDLLRAIKQDLRMMRDGDPWGLAMECFFECAGRQYLNGRNPMPSHWNYSPGLTPCDKDSMFYDTFKSAKNIELLRVGSFLYRYTHYLCFKGVDY